MLIPGLFHLTMDSPLKDAKECYFYIYHFFSFMFNQSQLTKLQRSPHGYLSVDSWWGPWQRCGCRTVKHIIGSWPGVSGLSGWGHTVWEGYGMKVSNSQVDFHLIHLSCLGHCLLLASVEPNLVHLDLGISALILLRSHWSWSWTPPSSGWLVVGLEHKHLLVGSRKEFGNIQISQNPRFIVLVHFGMVTSLFEHLLLAKKNHAFCGVDQFVSQIVGLWFQSCKQRDWIFFQCKVLHKSGYLKKIFFFFFF